MKTMILLGFLCVASCASTKSSTIARPDAPEGPKPNVKTWVTPTSVPTIQLARDNVPDFWVATPTIIDTNSFAEKHQLGDPIPGKHPRPANYLPPHQKPSLETAGPPNTLRAGFGNSNTEVYDEVTFDAISSTGWNPPDPSLAVGPNHVVVTVNMAIAFYDKQGNEEFSANLDSTGNPGFFEEIGGGNFTFDPKCFYDPHAQRFVVLALEQYGEGDGGESWITMAVSDDSDPNGVWYKYRTWSVITNEDNGDTFWVDYPGFGFDDGHWYVTGNLFGLNNGGWGGVLYRVFDKTPMLNGDPVVIADVRKGGHASMQGAQQYGDSPAAFFVGRRNNTELRIASITNPDNPSVVSAFVAVPNHSTPGGVPNPGGTISALDGRMMNAQYRDGGLWATHGISGENVSAVARWYEIDLTNWPSIAPTLLQSGDLAIAGIPDGLSSFFPAIASNKRGEVIIVVGAANTSSNPTLQLVGRKSSDAIGKMGTPTLVASSTTGAEGRWGDYFDMTIDPNNDTRFWYVGEVQHNSGWQTIVGSAVITCIEDINADGAVNISDLLGLISGWGTSGDGAEVAAPYDSVDIADILAVIGALGNCP